MLIVIDYHVNMIDVSSVPDPRCAIEHLYFAYRAFTAGPDRLLAERGLGRVHHRILYFVGRQPGLTVGTLLDTLGVSKQALNAPLRKLVAEGLVEAHSSPADKRLRLLSLTIQGRALEAQLSAIQTALLEAAFAQAGVQATQGWFAVMQQLAAQADKQPSATDYFGHDQGD